MARHANTPRRFMNLAMKFAVRLLNRLFRKMPDGSTDVPLWRYKGAKVPLHLDRFHPWGCAVHVHVEKKQRSKFESKTIPCVFFGYDDASSAAIMGKLPGFAIIYSAHGHYNDDDFPCRNMEHRGWDPLPTTYDQTEDDALLPWLGPGASERDSPLAVMEKAAQVPNRDPHVLPSGLVPVTRESSKGLTPVPSQHNSALLGPQQVQPLGAMSQVPASQTLRRSSRSWHPSEKALQRIAAEDACDDNVSAMLDYQDSKDDPEFLVNEAAARDPFFQSDLAYSTQDRGIPRSYAQILHLPEEEFEKWLLACKKECESHLAIPSISRVLQPQEWTKAPPVRLTWVFTKKDVYKARIVMLGQRMVEGVHFNDTHAPVPSITCVRIILAIMAATRRSLTQLDVKTAFLNAPIDIELDVLLPEGFGTGDGSGEFSSPTGRRRRALTAIPGCPQGSRVWRKRILAALEELGFTTFLPDEPCLLRDSHKDPIFLVLWVDDIIESAPTGAGERSARFHRGLRQQFPHGVTITAESTTIFHLLGCVVERPSPDLIRVHQKPYLQLLRRAGFEEGTTRADDVPVAPSTRFSKKDCVERVPGDREHRWFRSTTMSLNHAQNWTRPDLTYLVSKAAKYMQAPGPAHIKSLKKGLRYLRGKLDLGLVYDFRTAPVRTGLYGFFDASHADDIDTRRSTIAYTFFFSGCVLSWKSKLHTFVTTSTNHSELVAAAMAAREAKFLWKFFGALEIHDLSFPGKSDTIGIN